MEDVMSEPDSKPVPLAYAPAPELPEVPPTTAYQRNRLRHQLAFLLRDGQQWRTVVTDSGSLDGIAPRCTSPDHPEDDKLQQGAVYDCCDFRPIETHSVKLAEFFVAATRAVPALLAERDALAARVAELESRLHDLLQNGQPQHESGECEGCGCCTRIGCHRFADSTCPTDSLGDFVCPCTED